MWVRDVDGDLVNLNAWDAVYLPAGEENGVRKVLTAKVGFPDHKDRITLFAGTEQECCDFVDSLAVRLGVTSV